MGKLGAVPLRLRAIALSVIVAGPLLETANGGMLRVRDSESREVRSLSGMWNFRADLSPTRSAGFAQSWYQRPLSQTGSVIPMPVPSSYNDITQDKKLRDFVGWAWYDRQFYIAEVWKTKRVILRVESAHYNAIVWLNAKKVMSHSGGHLPFEANVTGMLNFKGINRVTIAINNTLSPITLPPGTIKYQTDKQRYPPGYFVQKLQMDFFNYAGIHRDVWLYTTPENYIDDITLKTDIMGTNGFVTYQIIAGGPSKPLSAIINILNMDGKVVATNNGMKGQITLSNINLWWPYTMMPKMPTYLYTFEVHLKSPNDVDIYRLPFGVRTVRVTDHQLLINDKPFYCLGLGRHEDADIRGKGLDYPLIAKDFNLMKWLGANCFRTSHYPYAEEIMDQADQQGFVVIDESPGVGIHSGNMGNQSLAHHLVVMEELVRRDKNRPSVIMWSVANEPQSYSLGATYYFGSVINHTRSLDPTRPVTYVMNADFTNDRAAQFVDVMCINRYYGWYSDIGHTEVVQLQVDYDLENWYKLHRKPIIITEYGAGSIRGIHSEPSVAFSEEYQADLLHEYHQIFDSLRQKYLVGEMVWNYADFMTVEGVSRVVGNRKGLLTRQRQPKLAAFLVRERYLTLGQNSTVNHTHNRCHDCSL